MNIIEKIASPQRNQGMYSSQRNLIDDDTSDDIVVGTIHNTKLNPHINKTFEIEDIDIHSFPTNLDTKFMDVNDDDSSDIPKKKKPKSRSVSKISSKKHKTKKRENKIEMNDITSQESTLSPSISSSKSDNDVEDLNFMNSLKSPNNYEDVLIVKKSIDSTNTNSEGVDESYKLSIKIKTKKKSKRQKTSKTTIDTDDENYHEANTHEDDKTDEKNKSITPRSEPNNSKIIGLHIIKCDVLENYLYLYKPFVRVYIIDKESGSSISSKNSPIKSDQNYAMTTKCYDFSTRRKIIPEWDEILMFNNELIKKIKSPANILIFFEIMDIVLSNENGESKEGNIQPLCWAFIKPFGDDLSSNMNKKLELQLYKVGIIDSNPNKINVYEWWKSKPWKNYPCTFNTIIMSLKAENSSDIVNNIKQTIVKDTDDKNVQTMNKYIANSKTLIFDKLKMEKRLNNEEIEIPNKIITLINNADGNSTILKFSYCGKYLAFSALENHKYIILIYKIPEFEEVVKLSHHKGLIYDICWNQSTSQLITASADNFVYIWNISETPKGTRKKLHHSSFVYTAKFCKSNEDTIVTGCYDTIIRVWVSNSSSENDKYILSEELSGHTGYVNTICFTDYNEIFFSGDSDGNILKWAKGQDGWVKILAANIEEFKGEIINDLQLFPDNHRMLVVLRNNASWAINLNTMSTFTCYKNGIPNRYQVRGSISPCGSFIFISNNIWRSSTGELCAIYNPTQFDHHPIMSLDYHPLYNLIAMSSDRKGIPILLCYHMHTQTVDLSLGIEVYSPNIFKCDKENSNDFKTKNKLKIETIKKMEEFKVTTSSNKNKQSKLWDLLKKMDDLLIKAKKSEMDEHVVFYKKETKISESYEKVLNNKEPKVIENESVSTVSANLTDFYERMNRFSIENEIDAKPSSSQTESDTSNNLGTYTLENEKPTKIKRIKKKKTIDYNENGGSSTLSNAESLEDDQNTYTILTNQKNNHHQRY